MVQLPNVPTRGKSPVFVDGRTTHKTYLVIAVKPGAETYNAVGVRRLGQDQFKFHFWPHAEFFNTKHDELYSRRNGGNSHGSYQGLTCTWDEAKAIISNIAATVEGVTTAPMDAALATLSEGYTSQRHFHG